jgi:hypothetical protein
MATPKVGGNLAIRPLQWLRKMDGLKEPFSRVYGITSSSAIATAPHNYYKTV